MALSEFYMQNTGSNLNAGSTNADAASITETNGSWDITSNTFIATAGLPFAAVNVGDWVSIYNDGASATPFVAQVTVINDLGLSITVSATVKFGTKPAAGATGKSCKVGGAWASLGMLASGVALNTGTTPVSFRCNIKAGTYANSTTNRTFGVAGTTLLPVWYRGYKTAIGDMDAVPTTTRVDATDIPHLTWGNGIVTLGAAHNYFTSMSILTARAGGTGCVISGNQNRLRRVRVENTSSNAGSTNCYTSGNGFAAFECWFKAHTSSLASVNIGSASGGLYSCVVRGGKTGIEITNSCTIAGNTIISTGSDGIGMSVSAAVQIVGNTFYSIGRDGIRWTTLPSSNFHTIANNVFSLCGGYNLKNNSGADTNFISRVNNCSYSPTSGHASGFGDSQEFGLQTDGSQTVTSATDMTPVSGSNANNNALPGGLFENEAFSNFGAIGAVQPEAAGGGGAGPLIGGRLVAC